MTNIASSGTYQLRQSIVTIGGKEEENNDMLRKQASAMGRHTHKKAALGLHDRTSSTYSGGLISPLRGPAAIVHHHKRSGHLGGPGKVSANVQTSTIQIENEEDSREALSGHASRPSRMSHASRYAVDEMIRDQTGITAARKRRQ